MGKSHVAASRRAKPARERDQVPRLSRLLRLLGVRKKKPSMDTLPTGAHAAGARRRVKLKPQVPVPSLEKAVKSAALSTVPAPSASRLGSASPVPQGKLRPRTAPLQTVALSWTVHCGGCGRSNPAMQEWCDFCGKEISPWTDPRFKLAGPLRG